MNPHRLSNIKHCSAWFIIVQSQINRILSPFRIGIGIGFEWFFQTMEIFSLMQCFESCHCYISRFSNDMVLQNIRISQLLCYWTQLLLMFQRNSFLIVCQIIYRRNIFQIINCIMNSFIMSIFNLSGRQKHHSGNTFLNPHNNKAFSFLGRSKICGAQNTAIDHISIFSRCKNTF